MNVLVTGGASNLGLAITRELLRDLNTRVMFTYHSSAEAAARLESEYGSRAIGIHCDFSDSASLQTLLEQIPNLSLEALVNNALPALARSHAHKVDSEALRIGFAANVLPTIAITQAALTQFRKARAGRIVTVLTSHLSGRPPVGLAAYLAEKAYLLAFSRSWSTENAGFGVTANCVSPSIMRTSLTTSLGAEALNTTEAAHPYRRLLTTPEVAEIVTFLLRTTPHINGINLPIDAAAHVI